MFDFLASSKTFNIYPHNIRTTWQWTHSGKCLRMCEFVKLLLMNNTCSNRIQNIDGFYTKTTQKGGFSELCVKIKKRCYIDLLHYSTRKHNLVSFFGRIVFWQYNFIVLIVFLIYSGFFSGENARWYLF